MAASLQRFRAQVFAATWLSYAGFYVTRRVFSVVKAPLKERFLLDDLQVSHLFTIYLVTYMLGQFLAAWLGRRMESRRVLACGMAVSAVCNFAIGIFSDSSSPNAYLWIFTAMGVHGFAQAMGWSHNVALIANWTQRKERGLVFGFWGTCYQIGSIAGKSLAAFLFGWLGLAWSFFGSSVVLLVIAGIFLLWARERPSKVGLSLEDVDEPEIPQAKIEDRESSKLSPVLLRAIFAMGAIYFGFKFLRYALDSWSALILTEHFALSTTHAGYLSAGYDWIGFLGVIAGGLWSDRLSGARRAPVIFFMSVCCLLATIGMWTFGTSSVTAYVVLLGLIGLSAMGPDSLLSGTSAMDVGSRRQAAVAAGIINGLGSIGPIIQEPAIGYLKKSSGIEAVLLLLVAVVFFSTIGTGVLWWMSRKLALRI